MNVKLTVTFDMSNEAYIFNAAYISNCLSIGKANSITSQSALPGSPSSFVPPPSLLSLSPRLSSSCSQLQVSFSLQPG